MIEREIGWNDSIENDGTDYVILSEGDYDFEVKAFKRGRFAGSATLPACNTADLEIAIFDIDGKDLATVKHSLYLHTKREWLVCQFFRSLGMRKHGEKFTPDWTKIVGKVGKCKIKNTKKANKKDTSKEDVFNNVDKFLDPPEDVTPPAQQNGFVEGTF